jgi:NAD(P)-dependent dehydrogenase (short-subunit alcohol dehydrogenase family)
MIAYGMAFPDKIDGMTKEMEKIPLKRVGDPEKDIGPVAVFLAAQTLISLPDRPSWSTAGFICSKMI